LLRAARGAELWAVVKADGYGHGAGEIARAALAGGASALCVASLPEALRLRAELPDDARILVLGPVPEGDLREARTAQLELVSVDGRIPEDVPIHVKLDTGMGRWGVPRLPPLAPNVVGIMSHFAVADSDPEFTRRQLELFREATAGVTVTRHIANSAATLRYPEAACDAVRCGIAVYGISPFDTDPRADGLEPALRWDSSLAQVKRLEPGQSTGYGRTFVAERPTWIGIVPVGYADGFRRDLTGTEILVDGERRPVVGTISMDALAVELERELPVGTSVTLIGDGVLVEEHARVAGTIGYEIATGLNTSSGRAQRAVRDG
jgi:alanine racemase